MLTIHILFFCRSVFIVRSSFSPGSIKLLSNRINWIYCVPFCLFRPYFLLNYSTNSVRDISFVRKIMSVIWLRRKLDWIFQTHPILLPFQCRDGIFHFYYTIGQLILHQQQKHWSKARITQNRLMNDEVASIQAISDGHNKPWNKDLLLHLLLHLDFHFAIRIDVQPLLQWRLTVATVAIIVHFVCIPLRLCFHH